MKLKVTGQRISIIEPTNLVAGTVNAGGIPFYITEFEFDNTWDGFSKTVIFESDTLSEPVTVSLTGNSCAIPSSVISNPGSLRITIKGIKGSNIYYTRPTNPIIIAPSVISRS